MSFSAPAPRIALFVPTLDGGGAERVMVNLARGFSDRGLSVDLLLVHASGAYLSEVPPTVRIVQLQAARASRSLLPLVRYLRRERPAALISTSSHANLVALLAKRLAGISTRSVVRQAETFSIAARIRARGRRRLVPLLVRHMYPWADVIIAGSEGVAQDLVVAARLPRSRIRVAPSPLVTPELFALAREPLDHPWLAPGADPVILSAGRLDPVKDFPTLIRAFALLREHRPARLVILGEGEERALLEKLIRDLGLEDVVSLPGFASNPFAYMVRARVFVLSSISEGLPGALIQALACGVHVVATDCQNGPREILRGGRFGRLVPVGNVAALAEAILAALGEPSPTVPEEAWRPYAQDAATDQYLRILQVGGNG
jgi:glycosyltransferase involved in cell wall biosynthesis